MSDHMRSHVKPRFKLNFVSLMQTGLCACQMPADKSGEESLSKTRVVLTSHTLQTPTKYPAQSWPIISLKQRPTDPDAETEICI